MATDLHRVLSGLDHPSPSVKSVEQVKLTPAVRQYISRLLSLPEVRCGGPMVGRRDGTVIKVTHLVLGGQPWRVGHVLTIDPAYVLGAVDALTQDPSLDWVGQWMTGDATDDLELARGTRWMTSSRPMLTLTYTPERPIIRAYSVDGGEEITEIPCQ